MEKSALESGPYTPLNTSRREVRLLRIVSSPDSAVVQCQSQTFRLELAPPYVALSYEWGPENDQERIYVNDCSVSVRRNLWSFLRLRGTPDDFEWIWVDALCIDQANLIERSHQVGFMAQIFSQAVLVLAWLGPSTDQIDTGLNFLEKYRVPGQVQRNNEQLSQIVEALGMLCKRAYWRRLWVLQELVLALEITVCVGPHLIPWTKFTALLLRIKKGDFTTNGTMQNSIPLSSAFSMFKQMGRNPANVTLLDRVLSVPRLACADPKDRIYALLGICKPSTTGMVLPDYKANNVEVVQDVLLQAEFDEFYGIDPFVDFRSKLRQVSAILDVEISEVFKLDATSPHFELQQTCMTNENTAGSIFWWAVSNNHRRMQQLCLKFAFGVLTTLPDSNSGDVQKAFELITSLPDFGSVRDSTGFYPLHHAVSAGSALAVRLLLKRPNVDINCRTPPIHDVDDRPELEYTPLMLAARRGNEDAVDLLLQRQDLDVNFSATKDVGKSDTALMLALSHGYEGIVVKLLSRPDIDVSCYSKYGSMPLQLAAKNGHEATVAKLLSRSDVNVNYSDGIDSAALQLAAEKGHDGIVAILLSKSEIDVNCPSSRAPSLSPLQLAVRQGHENVVRQLLERHDVHVNDRNNAYQHDSSTGKTALMIAAESGQENMVRRLLSRSDTDVNCGTDDGNATALQLAIDEGHESIAVLLLQRPELNIKNRCTLSDKRSNRQRSGKQDLPHILEHEYGWDMSATALMMAAARGYETVVRQLLQRSDIDVNCRSNNQPEQCLTPLQLATRNGHAAVVAQLLERTELDINHRFVPKNLYIRDWSPGYTALMIAAISRNEEIVRQLLGRSDLDINCRIVRLEYAAPEAERWTERGEGFQKMETVIPRMDTVAVLAWDRQEAPVLLQTLCSELSMAYDRRRSKGEWGGSWEEDCYRQFISALRSAVMGDILDLARFLCSSVHEQGLLTTVGQ